jgi:hypothetical protein
VPERERLRNELQEHGDRRRAARETDRRELEHIAGLLPRALQAGISKREIARLAGVSRPWIEQLIARQDDAGIE